MNFDFNRGNQQIQYVDAVRPRKPYHRPVLEVLGDLRTMTLGTSPSGVPDSGTGMLFEYAGDSIIEGFPPLPDEFDQPGDPFIPPL